MYESSLKSHEWVYPICTCICYSRAQDVSIYSNIHEPAPTLCCWPLSLRRVWLGQHYCKSSSWTGCEASDSAITWLRLSFTSLHDKLFVINLVRSLCELTYHRQKDLLPCASKCHHLKRTDLAKREVLISGRICFKHWGCQQIVLQVSYNLTNLRQAFQVISILQSYNFKTRNLGQDSQYL